MGISAKDIVFIVTKFVCAIIEHIIWKYNWVKMFAKLEHLNHWALVETPTVFKWQKVAANDFQYIRCIFIHQFYIIFGNSSVGNSRKHHCFGNNSVGNIKHQLEQTSVGNNSVGNNIEYIVFGNIKQLETPTVFKWHKVAANDK